MLCLPKPLVDRFVAGLKEGKLNPEDLSKLSSEERRNLLGSFVGPDNAQAVNTLFESKLLMKNQNTAMINWVKSVANMKEPVKRSLIDKIERLGKVLTPDEERKFLADLTSARLGTEITAEQANTISKLAADFTAARADPNSGLKYGATEVALNNFINDIRLSNEKLTGKEVLASIRKDPVYGTRDVVSEIAGAAKGIRASLDDSAIFRQGWKTMFTNPKIWGENALKTFDDIWRQLKVKPNDSKVLDGIKAEIYSRSNARSGLYKKMKLDVGNLEEAYPSSLPEKIPGFGRLYQASQTAYTGFLYRMRADIADKMINLATDQGVNMADKAQAESIGKLVNALTGRGYLGAGEKVAKEINTIFFSPKFLKSNFDVLTGHNLQKGVTPFVREQAAYNLVKIIAGTSVIMGIAESLHPGSVERDPRSSNFGKIKIGDTRYSIGGGAESLVTLASRTLPGFIPGVDNYTKSSSTGKLTKLNTGKFGSKTTMDIIQQFLENKLSPAASVIKELGNKKDFEGNPVTALGVAKNLAVPLPLENAWELAKKKEGADYILTMLAELFGISTNTY